MTLADAWRFCRAHEWWSYKVCIAVGTALMLGSIQGAPELCLPCFLLLVPMGIMAAVFASVINDVTDLEQDTRAGKSNAMGKFSSSKRSLILCGIGFALAAICMALQAHNYARSLMCYACTLLMFVMYSVPPFRLKERGLTGVITVALGEHFFPLAFTVCFLVDCRVMPAPNVLVLAALLTWSTALGIRSILWHQLQDAVHDKRSGTSTFGATTSPKFLENFGNRFVFPLEIFSIAAAVWLLHCNWLWWLLAAHVALEALRARCFGTSLMIVNKTENGRFAFMEFYQLMPVIVLISLATPAATLMAICFVLAFPGPFLQAFKDSARILVRHALPKLRGSAT